LSFAANIGDAAEDAAKADVERLIESIDTGHGYHKKIELLKDDGKRMTITGPNGKKKVRKVEYEDVSSEVNGSKLTVQLEYGGDLPHIEINIQSFFYRFRCRFQQFRLELALENVLAGVDSHGFGRSI
jgi:hypothetical protein